MAERSIRSFIAVPVPAAVRERLTGLLEALRGAGDIRWCTPDQYHLTLKFLGNASPGQLARVGAQLEKIAKNRSHFMLELDGLGAFPRLERPRVIWVGIAEGTNSLIELARQVDSACAPIGFERESRPYHPHLTLGRVRSPRDLDALVAKLRAEPALGLEPFAASEIHLMESHLRPAGAEYTLRERFALAT